MKKQRNYSIYLLFGLLYTMFILLALLGYRFFANRVGTGIWLIISGVILLILLYQYLASVDVGRTVPLLRLLAVSPGSAGSWIVAAEGAFAAYMLTFSIRTGRGI